MKKNRSPMKRRTAPKAIRRLPDLDHAKVAVLNSLTCPDAQRGYRHAMDEFIDWYCSSRVSPSIRPWCFGTVSTWNPENWRPERSTFGSGRCAVWPTKRMVNQTALLGI